MAVLAILLICWLTEFSSIFSIELFQYFIGRSADIDDLIRNFIGGFMGYPFFIILSLALGRTLFWKKALGRIK
jgi:glycopeptide antibiotics resistance protein